MRAPISVRDKRLMGSDELAGLSYAARDLPAHFGKRLDALDGGG
jgi:hypothetical protein